MQNIRLQIAKKEQNSNNSFGASISLIASGIVCAGLAIGFQLNKDDMAVDHIKEVCYLTDFLGDSLGGKHQEQMIMKKLKEMSLYVYEKQEENDKTVQIVSSKEEIDGWMKLGEYVPNSKDLILVQTTEKGNVFLSAPNSFKGHDVGSKLQILDDEVYELYKLKFDTSVFASVGDLEISEDNVDGVLSHTIYDVRFNYDPIKKKIK